ncbi:hypothetical protein HGRIS_005681 [Hohenbuehelia grisea]|uniref:Uncharacterized protein n=1 Tax=Hohenbuehelia grisea TaxID=104357 RepID=A0ABR3JYI3_9AGAR
MLLLTDHTDRESSVPLRPLPYCNVLSMQFSGFLQNLPTRHAVFFSHDGPYTIRLANGGIAHSFGVISHTIWYVNQGHFSTHLPCIG